MRSFPGRIVLLTAVLVAGLGAGCSGGGKRPDTAAVVEGLKVPSAETEDLTTAFLARQKAKPQAEALGRKDIAKLVLEYQIKLTFVEHLAKKLGVSTQAKLDLDEAAADLLPPEERGLVGERKEDVVRSLRAQALSTAIAMKRYPDVEVSEEAISQEYERLAPLLSRDWKATVRVARFGAEEPARQVRQHVEQGEPFEQAATALGSEGVATVDIDPVVAPLPAPVIDAIGSLATGQVSDAIPSGTGWLAALVERREKVAKPTLEDLRAELTDILAGKKRDSLFQEWFSKEFGKAKVKVDGYYGTWNAEITAVD